MLLHTAERQKRDFSRFCTLQKDKKEIFSLKASRGSMKFWLQLLYDNNAYRLAIGWGEVLVYFCFSTPILSFFS